MTPFVGEYKRYKILLEASLSKMSDEDFFKVLAPSMNSVAVIVKHISGNFRSRFTNFLTEDGEKPWRDRETEFNVDGLSRDDLMKMWTTAWETLEENVFELEHSDLQRNITIRNTPFTVEEALIRSLAHFSHHVGEVLFSARIFTADRWEYLSVAPGMSDEYNKNPTSEKISA